MSSATLCNCPQNTPDPVCLQAGFQTVGPKLRTENVDSHMY